MDEFDVVVIGGGAAGENVAGRCTECGLSIAVVEADLLGGECSYWACMPSKTLLRPGHVRAAARRVPGAREAVTGELDVAAALARRDWVTGGWDDAGQVPWLEAAGGILVRGHGRLAGGRIVEVDQGDGSTRRLTARRAVVIATGSAAAIPPIDGLREIRTWDSRDVTSAKDVPGRLLVLGGGVVGVEMAQAWRRLGARRSPSSRRSTGSCPTKSRLSVMSCAARSRRRASPSSPGPRWCAPLATPTTAPSRSRSRTAAP